MILYSHIINQAYATAGLLLLVATIVLFYDYYRNDRKLYKQLIEPYVWPLIMFTTLGGVVTTLFYSEVLGFIPCSLCWLQRIALYPQALLSIAANKVKDSVYYPLYGIVLSIAGLITALYQYVYQALPAETIEAGIVPCLVDGTGGCRDTVMEVFGFVTFPFLSAVLFLFLIVLYLNLRRDAQLRSITE